MPNYPPTPTIDFDDAIYRILRCMAKCHCSRVLISFRPGLIMEIQSLGHTNDHCIRGVIEGSYLRTMRAILPLIKFIFLPRFSKNL